MSVRPMNALRFKLCYRLGLLRAFKLLCYVVSLISLSILFTSVLYALLPREWEVISAQDSHGILY